MNNSLVLALALALSALVAVVHAQSGGTFNEPPGQRRVQTYRVLEYEDGGINQRYKGVLRYYCTFRGKWNEERHPKDFPKSPSFSAPIMIAHSNGYRMWTGTEAATLGVEQIAEEGFNTVMTREFNNAGFESLMMVEGERMFNTSESQHLPPINVTFEHPFLSLMTKFTPSPDWFGGFSDLRMISYESETYFNRVVIQSYVWDAGTDAGQSYTALDRDEDPQEPVSRITKNNIPHRKPFLSPDESYIPVPLEIECILRVGDGPVIPGVAFDESQIRPPLYVPRPDDDFIDGMEPHNWWLRYGNGECHGKFCNSAVSNNLMVTAVAMLFTTAASWFLW